MSNEVLIRTIDVMKSFRTEAGDLKVLKGIDLSIRKGEMLGVIGASGAGKSTLLQILGALDKPTSGKVQFKGRDIASMDDNSLARLRNTSIGFVFQFHHLLPEFNSIENAMFPAIISGMSFSAAEKKAKALLDELGLSERVRHRPGELSGGEQQRVAVARALIQDPEVVLADEPTGNLDTATGNDLFELFLGLNERKGITFVVVTHNKSLSDRCHRVVEMADGMFL
ncbi:outer membrane-specific lipoprotein transporter subunit; ATP-binding component of ABC superfamily [Candidatus Sulfobium mesophilum]|uniref:Outer membrane-specific lipoprotein transporter subunit ATP-binding component of ABC superfamily n=1 Tax=Candidatus Sulfobium mesophilum TaxID=2016548 RepID=A0A2U3QJ14_9BACT|nr:outer membrane-specific lipoprotein transporter subunit; ATP-binding component of ABC superfamily [Candidatus Sulfobium mesophilum]